MYPEGFMKNDCEPFVPVRIIIEKKATILKCNIFFVSYFCFLPFESFFPEKQFTQEEMTYPSESLLFSLMSWGKFKKAYEVYLL